MKLLSQSPCLEQIEQAILAVTEDDLAYADSKLKALPSDEAVQGKVEKEWIRRLWIVMHQYDALQDEYLAKMKAANSKTLEDEFHEKSHRMGDLFAIAHQLFWGEVHNELKLCCGQFGVRSGWQVVAEKRSNGLTLGPFSMEDGNPFNVLDELFSRMSGIKKSRSEGERNRQDPNWVRSLGISNIDGETQEPADED